MKTFVHNVVFRNYNEQDNLYFEVEEDLSNLIYNVKPEFSAEKNIENEGRLWVKIWSNGLSRIGYTKFKDPLHGNKEYTWSSNADCINREFNLIGTKYELSKYGAGVKTVGDSGCYLAMEITKDLAWLIGERYQDSLHWGLEQWKLTIDTTAPYVDGRNK